MLYMYKNEITTFVMTTSLKLSANTTILTYEDDQLSIYYQNGQEHIINNIVQYKQALEQEQKKWFPNLKLTETLPVFILDKEHPFHDRFFQDTKKGVYYMDLHYVVINAETYAPENNFVHEYAHFLLE